MTTAAEKRKAKELEEQKAQAAEEAGGESVYITWVAFGDRVISKADFASVGVEHEDVEWNRKNRYTATVSQAAAEYLLTEETGFEATAKLRKAKLKELGVDLAVGEATDGTGNEGGGGDGSGTTASGGSTASSTVG